jgi:hypothetical protein
MSRISEQALARAINKVHGMSRQEKETLVDSLYRKQPAMLASLIVQKRLGVSLEKMEFLLNILLICFQAMKESGIHWPAITEDDQDRQAARYEGVMNFGRDLTPSLGAQSLAKYVQSHPEAILYAYVFKETTDWLARVSPAEESDKYVVMAAANFVDCIAHVQLPKGAQSADANFLQKHNTAVG